MPTIRKWLSGATQNIHGEHTNQQYTIEPDSQKSEPPLPIASNGADSQNLYTADTVEQFPSSQDMLHSFRKDEVENTNNHSQQGVNDTSGCWSIGAFSQDENEPVSRSGNFRDQALFSQIAYPGEDADDIEGSSYSSILGDLSPRLSDEEMGEKLQDETVDAVGKYRSLRNRYDQDEDGNAIEAFDNGAKTKFPSALSIAEPSSSSHKAPVFVSSKAQTLSLSSGCTALPESSKRKHTLASAAAKETQIKLVENGLAMKAKLLVDVDKQAHAQWDTSVRGYMAQLGSVAYLGPIYPNTQLFRIVDILDDKGLVCTYCIRVAEPPEELVWSHVSAAENQSQYDSQSGWFPSEDDNMDNGEHQIIFFSFFNSNMSQAMRARFNQSRLIRIWPPWHEHLLQLEDGSVTTIKLVTQFITDAIY